MTPLAIRQFINLVGGEHIARGARYEEPLRGIPPHVAFLIGQQDYLSSMLRFGYSAAIICPFVRETLDAQQWAKGRGRERMDERVVVDAYERAGRLA